MKTFVVGTETTVADVEIAAVRGQVLTLDPQLSNEQLNRVIARYQDTSQGDELAQLVAQHASVNDALLRALWMQFSDDPDVLSAIATCGKAGPPLLQEFASHPEVSVREHAQFAILEGEMQTATNTRLLEIMDAHQGDEGISLGIRHALATLECAPLELLKRLADDDADFIAAAAATAIRNVARPAE